MVGDAQDFTISNINTGSTTALFPAPGASCIPFNTQSLPATFAFVHFGATEFTVSTTIIHTIYHPNRVEAGL